MEAVRKQAMLEFIMIRGKPLATSDARSGYTCCHTCNSTAHLRVHVRDITIASMPYVPAMTHIYMYIYTFQKVFKYQQKHSKIKSERNPTTITMTSLAH